MCKCVISDGMGHTQVVMLSIANVKFEFKKNPQTKKRRTANKLADPEYNFRKLLLINVLTMNSCVM